MSLDGCIDHSVLPADEELHHRAAEAVAQADALILGRVTYQLMEDGFRSAVPGTQEGDDPFARSINAVKKYVVSSQLKVVDWNSEFLRGDLGDGVRDLKQQPGGALATGGVMLPLALTELGLIDEYEFIVHPRIVGHGPSLFAGLSMFVDLQLVGRDELCSGAVALRYEPRR